LDFEPDGTKSAESNEIDRWNDWKHWDVIGDMKRALNPEIDPKMGLPKEDAACMVRQEEWVRAYFETLEQRKRF